MSKQMKKKLHSGYSILLILLLGIGIHQLQKKNQLEPLTNQAIDLAESSQRQALDAQNITEQQSSVANKELARMTEAKAHI
ncbi:MAG: hypothetical protein ACJA0X_000916 [Cyclobacteriaceae bacterium]|jgi:hypothetical protein